jgi:hypothetical protein
MALIKHRPDVRLLLPRPLLAGRAADFIVELDCSKPVPVDTVSLRLFGDLVWFTTNEYGRHHSKSRFLDHAVPLIDEQTELGVGVHRLRAQLLLGEQLPGTWTGEQLAVEYAVEVHVDIPWWPDKRAMFVVRLADGREALVDDQPTVYVSHAGGPPGKGPYLELSLGQRSVRAGGLLRASAALGNVELNQYRKLQVEIIAQESYPNALGRTHVHEHALARWSVGVEGHTGELQPIPFSVELPRGLSPAFELHGCQLRWFVQVSADVAWGVDPKVRVPIVVQPAAIVDAIEVVAPVAVGSDRLRLIWLKVADDHELAFDHDRLCGARGEVAIEIRRDSEEGPTRVLGRLGFPSLGVGLRPHRERRGLLGALATGLAARDDDQTRLITERLGAEISASKYELLAADDQHLCIALEHAGLELAPLSEFAGWLVELASRVAALPAAMPIPACMREHAHAWARGAKLLGGRLRMAEPCIELERDGLRVSLACSYDDDGQLRATELTLDPVLGLGIDPESGPSAPGLMIPTRHQLFWSGDTALPEHELDLRDLVVTPDWAAPNRVALLIEAQRVRVFLPAPLPDPLLERERIEALLGLGRQLRGEQGPYR